MWQRVVTLPTTRYTFFSQVASSRTSFKCAFFQQRVVILPQQHVVTKLQILTFLASRTLGYSCHSFFSSFLMEIPIVKTLWTNALSFCLKCFTRLHVKGPLDYWNQVLQAVIGWISIILVKPEFIDILITFSKYKNTSSSSQNFTYSLQTNEAEHNSININWGGQLMQLTSIDVK